MGLRPYLARMFAGIIEACVPVRTRDPSGDGARLTLEAPSGGWDVGIGDSIAVSGCCLTLAERDGSVLSFDLSAETLARTTFEGLTVGTRVNLERSVRLSDRIGGHLVSGHVDGGGRIVASVDSGDGGRVFSFEVDPGLDRYLIDKGSVTIDGISLTVVNPEGLRFDVAVIPTTLEATNLGTAREGQRVNIEADLIGKWVESLLVRN